MGDLSEGVEFEPCGDDPRDDQVEGADVEGEDGGRGDGVGGCGELGDVVGDGDAEDARVRVAGLGEEAEDVFVVEVAVGEGAGDVDAAVDLEILLRLGTM